MNITFIPLFNRKQLPPSPDAIQDYLFTLTLSNRRVKKYMKIGTQAPSSVEELYGRTIMASPLEAGIRHRYWFLHLSPGGEVVVSKIARLTPPLVSALREIDGECDYPTNFRDLLTMLEI